MSDIVNRIDEFLASAYPNNVFYDDGKKKMYKDKNNLIAILRNSYKDDDRDNIKDVADSIISLNKKGKKAYIGGNPYDSDVHSKDTVLGAFESQDELEDEQDSYAQDI